MSHFQGPVLAVTDLSEAGAEVLRQGQAMAAAAGVQLVAGHVFPEAFRVRLLFPQAASVAGADHDELMRKSTAAVRAQVESLLGRTGDAIGIETESGSVHGAVLMIAHRIAAGVVVMAPGSAAIRVARSAERPVLIARSSPAGGPIIGATDFSDPSLPAIHTAAAEATKRGVPLRLIHCLDIDAASYLAHGEFPGMIAMTPVPVDVVKALESDAERQLDSALAATGVLGATQVLHRNASAGILESVTATGASLLVVGTRGRTGLARLALGSVAEHVATHADCSVLVVPLQSEHA